MVWSSLPRIVIMRSSVKRPSFTLRIRENSDAAIPVSFSAARTRSLRSSSTPMILAARIARLFKIRIRHPEVAEYIAAALHQFKIVVAHRKASLAMLAYLPTLSKEMFCVHLLGLRHPEGRA